MFESMKSDSTEKRVENDKKYRHDLAVELRSEENHEKRRELLFQKQKDREYFASFEVAKLRHNVYAKTRGQFAPERLDIITSLIGDEINEDQKAVLMKTAFDELIFEMAECKPEDWQQKLDAYLEKSLENRGKMVENINNYILDQNKLDRKLRSHQLGALVKIRDFIEQGFLRGYVAHPTGAGKTMLFSSLIKAIDVKTLIVVPTKLLVKQTLRELRRNMKDKKLSYISTTKEEDMNKVKDKKLKLNAMKGVDGDIVVITSQSLKLDTEGIRDQNFDMVIVDEAHNSYTGAAQHALRHFPSAIKLAFTATPDYYYTEEAPGFVERDLDGNKLYLNPEKSAARYYPHEIDRIPLREAIEMKMLTDLCAAIVRIDIDLDEVKTNQTKYGLDLNEEDLGRVLEKHWPTLKQQVIKTYFEGIKSSNEEIEDVLDFKDKQIFAVCSSVKQAEDLADEFCKSGVNAVCITGETSDDERDEIFEKYKNKEIQILTSVSVLKEGWDMPEAQVCLMLRPTLSRTFYEQVLGRVLRLDENNSEKVALMVDFLGKYTRMTPMTAPGMFGMEEFYNGQFIVPKKKKREETETKDADIDQPPYKVSAVLQKIERVEKVEMISDDLLKLGNDVYATKKFLEEKFFIKPERLQGFLENNAVATTKIGKTTFVDLKDVVQSYIRRGEVSMCNLDYAALHEISELLRLQKDYIAAVANEHNISRYWETDAYNNKYESYETGPLWRAIEKNMKDKLDEISKFDVVGFEKKLETLPVKQKKNRIERDKSLVLEDAVLNALRLNSAGDIVLALKHMANQKNAVGVKKRLGMIYIPRELSEETVSQITEVIEQIKERQDFKKDREIAGECSRILNDIEKKKGRA